MELQNGYKVIYEATRDDIGEKRFYGSKILQGVEEKMLISYDASTGEYVDLSIFKLIYTDMLTQHLYGSVENVPTENDIHISIYDTDGNLVFGCDDVPPVPPVSKYHVTTNDIENCVVVGAGEYDDGASVKVTVTPATGYRFASDIEPKANGEDMTLDEEVGNYWVGYIIDGADINVEITGVRVEAIPKHTVSINDVENCTVTGAGQYQEGKTVTVTLKVNAGYRFADGNDPKIDGQPMVKDGAGFKYEFVMGIADKEITIEGVVIGIIPADVYFSAIDTPEATLADDPDKISYTGAECYADYKEMPWPEKAQAYYRFAIKDGVNTPDEVFQNGFEKDVLHSSFNPPTSANFEGAEYTIFTSIDKLNIPGDKPDTYKFVAKKTKED